MKGAELSKEFFNEYGLPMLKEEFPELLPFLAAGFTGSGSEHYGFDDEISRDHDFEPGFCLFLPGEDIIDRRKAFLLERAYDKLPKEYKGIPRLKMSPVGGNRHGVHRTAEFYSRTAGTPDGLLSAGEWLRIPDFVLAEATNGEIFLDNYGEVGKIRRRLLEMPEDIRLKRLAGCLLSMAQSGQYNFSRCIAHGEPEAAQLAATEFANAAMRTVFLLHGQYMPYYKWSFRALRETLKETALAEDLSALLSGDNREAEVQKIKCSLIEKTAGYVAGLLKARGYLSSDTPELEPQAYALNQRIRDGNIRNSGICVSGDGSY